MAQIPCPFLPLGHYWTDDLYEWAVHVAAHRNDPVPSTMMSKEEFKENCTLPVS